MTVKTRKIELDSGRRILITSDIHGHLSLLESLLEKSGYTEDDYLFIVGDIVEKGPDSLATLRRVMELSAASERVIISAGNVDMWRLVMLDRLNYDTAEKFYNYLLRMRNWKGTCLYDEMAKELGISIDSPADTLTAKEKIETHFIEEFNFLRSLPAIVETQKYIFVHGGLPSNDIDSLADRNVFDVLKIDNFMSLGMKFDKYIVVGHWPVTLYNDNIAQANPIINREQKIISIDGGCGLKWDGQLNMLIIPDINCSENDISHISADALPKVRALDQQACSENSINICWIDNKIRLLERGEHFTLAEHISSGRKVRIFNKYISESSEETVVCHDYTDYILPVKPGDTLALIYETPCGYIVKKDGVSGWYYGRIQK